MWWRATRHSSWCRRLSPIEPEAAPARHEPAPLAVQSDEAYSPFDQLFVPQLRMPGVLASLGERRRGPDGLRDPHSRCRSVGATGWLGTRGPSTVRSTCLRWRTPSRSRTETRSWPPGRFSAVAGRQGFFDEAYWSGALSVDSHGLRHPPLAGPAGAAGSAGGRSESAVTWGLSSRWPGGASESTPLRRGAAPAPRFPSTWRATRGRWGVIVTWSTCAWA
jgi:hypothetical protein